jgi:chromosome segregation ATPase
MQEINELRARLAQLTSERRAISDHVTALRAKRNEADKAYNQAVTALCNQTLHWSDEAGLKAKRDAAKAERAALEQKVQPLEQQYRQLSEQERNCREKLARAEYAASKASDLEAEMGEAVAWIHNADCRLAQLAAERLNLEGKRGAAEYAVDLVRAAVSGLADAREAFEQQKANAFIAGRDTDLSPYKARVAKAEKRLADAKRDADAGTTALPMIAKRLESLTGKREGAEQDRDMALERYWHAYMRLYEVKYRQATGELVEIVNMLRALDRKTGRLLGHRLHEAMREGLRVPVIADSDYPRPLELSGNDDTLREVLSRMESELATVLAEEEAT